MGTWQMLFRRTCDESIVDVLTWGKMVFSYHGTVKLFRTTEKNSYPSTEHVTIFPTALSYTRKCALFVCQEQKLWYRHRNTKWCRSSARPKFIQKRSEVHSWRKKNGRKNGNGMSHSIYILIFLKFVWNKFLFELRSKAIEICKKSTCLTKWQLIYIIKKHPFI